ncbi:MAG: esterase FrsA [Alphaproteobacteria bacterium]|nr:esterase FrsA [Alphaproteobacteria bacterium]
MTQRSDQQRWALDTLLANGGFDVLHPGAEFVLTQFGYDAADFQRVVEPAKAGIMVRDRFGRVAMEVEQKAQYHINRGHITAGRRLYHRASLLYGRAYYSYYSDDPRRLKYQNSCNRCFEEVISHSNHTMERVNIPFEGKTAYGLFEAPQGIKAAPCLILVPGMDMFKEDWHQTIETMVLPKGWAAFAIDGPGQGESLTNGLKVGLDNYESAISKVIDWLIDRPEVDSDNIMLMGVSMGSYWGSRTAARESRLKAVATMMACYGSKHIIFDVAQPSYKANFMYMAGYEDEEKFDELASAMINDDLYGDISCPILMVTGEYDELTRLEDTYEVYEMIKAPKELWVYGEEFHPIGPSSGEWILAALDWLQNSVSNPLEAEYSRKIYITPDGRYDEKVGEPPWWHPPQ